MVNRREFLSATIAGAATVARLPSAFAAQATRYDLVIRGGRVIDPAAKLDAVRDVAIANGRIAAVEPRIAAAAAETIDAGGKLVVPGLLDIHTHTGRSPEGPGLVLRDGVTGGSMPDRRARTTLTTWSPSPVRRRSRGAS